MNRPNFFIVGAPKCGTSALYYNLRQHPQIFMAEPKELNFFATDITSPEFKNDPDWYTAFFEEAEGYERVGEASVWYLFSRVAAARIKEYSPDARIIAILRNPTDMIYSYHSQRIWNHTEDIKDFGKALAAIPDRVEGRRLPDNPYPLECLNYWEIAEYATQLQRYIDLFGRDNVKILIFEDYKASPKDTYREVFEFLDVDPEAEVEFQDGNRVRNANKRPRSERLSRFLRRPPRWLTRAGKVLLPKEDLRKGLLHKVRRMNVEWKQRESMDTGLRTKIVDHFRPEVSRLSEMIGRDLTSTWK